MPNTSEHPFHVGDVIAGKYRVERVLGEGGMGVVAAATHLQLDQLVAVKFVLPSMLESKMVVERFLREAKAAVRLKSVHAARILDVDTTPAGVPYMVMEYLEGADLSQVLKDSGPLPVHVAADYIIQACEALAEAHALGIVHRDLKPQNLFLTRGVGGTPLVKVLDFGISKMADDYTSGLTNPQMMMGSPQYMAPEQMKSSRSVDGRADIWALGVVLFRLVTNALPFGNGPMPELCYRVVNESPASLTNVGLHTAPMELAAIVAKCLEKDPAKRFATAGELALALQPFASVAVHSAVRGAQAADQARASMLSIPPASNDRSIPPGAVPMPPVGSGPAGAMPRNEATPSPTLAPWGPSEGRGWKGDRNQVIGLLGVLGIAAFAFFAMRGARTPTVTASGAGAPAITAPKPVLPAAAPPPVAAPPVTVEKPAATVDATPPVPNVPPLPVPATPAPRPSAWYGAPHGHGHAANPGAHPAGSAAPTKDGKGDDDIPQFR
ncbi:MAG TPA: serine/threonine-protein kinase [Polyangiaceae bacterium]